MRVPAATAVLLGLFAAAASGASAIGPMPLGHRSPTVAYVTQTGFSPATVVVADTDGGNRTSLGPGTDPLLGNGLVAASLFGTGAGSAESGPALVVYRPPAGPASDYLSLAHVTARPLAWSREGRYLAVDVQANGTPGSTSLAGLAVVDIGLNKATLIARGTIYGASFSPFGVSGPEQLVYARAAGENLSARVNLFVCRSLPKCVAGERSATTALTGDGHSLNPVWGVRWIAYDRERLRRNEAPQYQIWLRSTPGSKLRKLTNVAAGPLVSGLVPLAFGDAGRLLAEFEGQDTSEAWTVTLSSGRARRVKVNGRTVQGAGISRDGSTLLVEEGAFEQPASSGRVLTVPFAGGKATVVVAHGAQASWNG